MCKVVTCWVGLSVIHQSFEVFKYTFLTRVKRVVNKRLKSCHIKYDVKNWSDYLWVEDDAFI